MMIDRSEVIKRLRALNKLSDEEIGQVVGITRERVAQIAGRKKEDPGPALYKLKCEKILRRYLVRGFTLQEIVQAAAIPLKDLHSALDRLSINLSDFSEARRRRKIMFVTMEAKEFIRKYNVPLLTTNLMRMDRVLYNRMWTLLPIREWRKLLNQA